MVSTIKQLLEDNHLTSFFTESLKSLYLGEYRLYEFDDLFGEDNVSKVFRTRYDTLGVVFTYEDIVYQAVYSIAPFTGGEYYLHLKCLETI